MRKTITSVVDLTYPILKKQNFSERAVWKNEPTLSRLVSKNNEAKFCAFDHLSPSVANSC